MRRRVLSLAVAVLMFLSFAQSSPPQTAGQSRITSPEAFFGFRLGTDRKIARWDRIVEYCRLLEKEGGGRLKVVDMGPSTMGHPFLLLIVSSSGNLLGLDRLKDINALLSNPRGIDDAAAARLVEEGKAVVCQTMSLHASEIGGTQMAPELAYDLVSRNDPETVRIRENVISLVVPSFNPDGALMISDWYERTLGTEYEGTELPWLYHKYAGHDNNRDAFMTNLVESRYMAAILFRDWTPQAYVDHHHMGSYGARLYVPPYAEPVRPGADPLVWREHSWYGAHIAYKEEEAGLSGIINMAQYSGWGHFGFHWVTPFHNIAGMLTESATAKLATPIYIHPGQLKGGVRGLPEYEEQTTFPNPWNGGWWKLRDIIDRQKVSAWAVLDLAARNKETVLRNAYLKARRQTERGARGKPAAYVVPAAQHDPLTCAKLVDKLLIQGIEVTRARAGFTTRAGMTYGAGSYIVSLAQPKSGLIRYLLGRTRYPDNSYTRDREGSPIRPYDMATDTMFEFMGVRVDPIDDLPEAASEKAGAPVFRSGSVRAGKAGFWFDGRLNDSFRAANLLLDRNVPVRRLDTRTGSLRPGDFYVASAAAPALAEIAGQTGVDFRPLDEDVRERSHAVKRGRVGMYQRYRGGNMDEGWTRLLLEQFSFPFTVLKDVEIRKGGLEERYDVIVLAEDSIANITGERPPGERDPMPESYPEEYKSGIGKEGVDALKSFVRKGGTLVTLGGASAFAIEKLELPIRNVVAGKLAKEFFCPGSTLRARFDATNPLAYGMPAEALVISTGSPAFEILPTEFNHRYEVPVVYPDRDILQSGWLIGEQHLARRAALVSAGYGAGRAILVGFRAQHRAQAHGTFKVFFNTMIR